MNYWIFTALSPKEDGLTAREVYDTRMRDKFWGFEKTARNLKNLQPGDKVIYYVGRPDMVFAGSATLASTAFKLSEAQKENYSHGISFYRVNLYGVLIEDIDRWSSPKPVKTIKQELKFIENKDNWGFYLRGSVRKIDEQDYRTIINFQRRDRTNINVQEVTPVAINGAKKILNIILRKRDQLKQGNYIRKADPKEDYLFDFFVNKLKKYKYSRKFGVNFNLIIAGSETKENDFFIIPYSSISHMLRRKYTSTHKNKSKRWVGSIKHNQLRINNCPETLNVVQFYGNLNYLRQPQTQGLEYQEVEKSRGDWYKYEVEETVKDYFEMLSAELGGEHYNKTEHRKALLAKLKKRSEVAIEFKHQNISAALIAKGLPYIEEYIPLGNYQSILDDAIDNYLKANPEFLKLISRSVESVPTKEPIAINFDEIVEQAPEPGNQTQEYSKKKRSYQARKYDLVKKEAENKKLGKLGEEFAVKFEQDRLIKAGRVDLANKVERISETKGDGAGYDVLSFEADGSERFIEVKTTNFGKSYPFNITANELDFSEDSSGHYYLYRVFKFKDSPKLFILEGSLKDKFNLIPTVYKLSF